MWVKSRYTTLGLFSYNDSLEFDSDELDLLNLDWEDVQQVRCHARQSVLIEEPGSDYGVFNSGKLVRLSKGSCVLKATLFLSIPARGSWNSIEVV